MKRLLALSILLLGGGCVSNPDGSLQPPELITVVGTPFLIAFKIPTCVASLALAAPAAGGLEPASPYAREQRFRPYLRDGVKQNCGPPYAVGF